MRNVLLGAIIASLVSASAMANVFNEKTSCSVLVAGAKDDNAEILLDFVAFTRASAVIFNEAAKNDGNDEPVTSDKMHDFVIGAANFCNDAPSLNVGSAIVMSLLNVSRK